MKKLLYTICALILSTFSINAQNYTPSAGDWALSTNAHSLLDYAGNLFISTANSPEVDFTDDNFALRAKYFTEDNQAYRVGLDLYMTSSWNTDNYRSSSYAFVFAAGKEYRRGSDRLQGVYGYEANLMLMTETYDSGSTNETQESSHGFGCDAFIGVEYFIARKMSLGAEYKYGFMFDQNPSSSSFSLGGHTSAINLNFYF